MAGALTLTSCGPAAAEAGQKPPRDRYARWVYPRGFRPVQGHARQVLLEVGTGALPEAVLDLGGCDYSGQDLSGKILSGVIATGANFSNATLVGAEMSRAKGQDAIFTGANMRSVNALRGELRRV